MNKTLLSILLAVTLILSFTACSSSLMVNKVKKLEIGMTKKEVINTMGKDYTTLAARQTPDGALETIRYESITPYPNDYSYIISFLDGKLVEWHIDEPRQGNQHQHRSGNPNP